MTATTRFGLIRSKYRYSSAGSSPYTPTVTITPSLSNANAVVFDVSSNLQDGVTLYYEITGASATDFTDSTTTGNITISSGAASFTKLLEIENNLDDGSKEFYVTLRSGGVSGDPIVNSTNVLINKYEYITALGGTLYYLNNATEKLHVFTNTGTDYLDVTDIGDTSGNVRYVVIGGGGAGGVGTNFGVSNRLYCGGGGSGEFRAGNSNISVSNITIVVGAGGTPGNLSNIELGQSTNGNNSSFGNIITAYGGGAGGGAHVPTSNTIPYAGNTFANTTIQNGKNGNSNLGGGGGGSFKAWGTGVGDIYYDLTDGTAGDSSDVYGRSLDGAIGFGNGVSLGGNQTQYVRQYSAGSGGGGANEPGYQGFTITPIGGFRGRGGAGGNGIESDISGNITYYAGGGGASGSVADTAFRSVGGIGGGGDGYGGTGVGSAGGVNSGGGGGGGGFAGGSGIVFVRYAWDNPRKFALS